MHYARRRGAGIVLISDQITVSPHKRARPLPRIVRTIIYSVAAPGGGGVLLRGFLFV